jgi:hypothetical protein
MLSRVANSIYWMSRYIERAENVARFMDVNLNLMLDLPVGSAQQWQPLVDITGDTAAFEKRYGAAHPRRQGERALGPRDHLLRHVGAAQRFLSADQFRRGERRQPEGSARCVHIREDVEPSIFGRHRRHHDAQ